MADWKAKKKYHELSLEEIKSRYYVHFSGEEDPGQFKYINGRIATLWQDVAFFYNDTNTLLSRAKNELRRIEETLDLEEKKVEWKYICENKVLPKGDRMTDDARECAAFIETRTDKLKENLSSIRDIIADLHEEVSVWDEVRNNLKMISKRIDTASMNSAVELKITGREYVNVPLVDRHLIPDLPENDPLSDPASSLNAKPDDGELF